MNPLLESFLGFRLSEPWWLLVLLVLPALWYLSSRARGALTFAPAPLLVESGTPLPRTWRTRLHRLPGILRTIGITVAAFALARPVERQLAPVERKGIDILLCLDRSSSMAATDMAEDRTRLDVARATAAAFVSGRPEDRIGLVGFARYPDLMCPATLDHRTLLTLLGDLDMVEPDSPEDQTGIGTAIARGAQILADSGSRSRVLILVTDGEETVATPGREGEIGPLVAAQLCKELGVRVYALVVGIGNPSPSGQWQPLDTGPTRVLAESTGGRFFEAKDAGSLAGMYGYIDALEKVKNDEQPVLLIDRFGELLLLALILLGLGEGLRVTALEVSP